MAQPAPPAVMADVGGNVGAAVVYTPEALLGRELEIRRAGRPWDGTHTAVRERTLGASSVCAGFLRVAGGALPGEAPGSTRAFARLLRRRRHGDRDELQLVDPGGVAADHQALLFDGDIVEVRVDELLHRATCCRGAGSRSPTSGSRRRSRSGSATPTMSDSNVANILTVPVEARLLRDHLALEGVPAVARFHRVEPLEEVGNPAEAGLDEHDLEPREALEGAAEDPARDRSPPCRSAGATGRSP